MSLFISPSLLPAKTRDISGIYISFTDISSSRGCPKIFSCV